MTMTSAEKANMRSLKKRVQNKIICGKIRMAVKNYLHCLSDSIAAQKAFSNVQACYMRAVSKGAVHKNTCTRKLTRLAHKKGT